MVQQLLPLLPDEALSTLQTLCCVAALALGVFLWLTGSIWSRGIVTLLAVALGAALGMYVPRWQLWPINSMAGAVLGAVAFGVSAFLVERMWVGLTLAFVLTAWTFFGTWILCRPPDFVWNERAEWEVQHLTPPQLAKDVYERLPEEMRQILPYAIATAVLSGFAMASLWPRFGRAACFSALGITTMVLCGLTLLSVHRPDWLRFIPSPALSQAGLVAGLVMVGLLAQWPFNARRDPRRSEQEQPAKSEAAVDRQLSRMFS